MSIVETLSWLEPPFTALGHESQISVAIFLAISTLVLEDAALFIGTSVVVVHPELSAAIFLGLSIGIAVGDIGLYFLGYWLGERAIMRRYLSSERFITARGKLQKAVIPALLIARIIPASRFAVFTLAGITKVPSFIFISVAITSSFLWTLIVLESGGFVLQFVQQYVGPYGLGAIFVVILVSAIRRMFHKDDKEALNSHGGDDKR